MTVSILLHSSGTNAQQVKGLLAGYLVGDTYGNVHAVRLARGAYNARQGLHHYFRLSVFFSVCLSLILQKSCFSSRPLLGISNDTLLRAWNVVR